MKTRFTPGWKMTPSQVRAYWKLFESAAQAQGAFTAKEKDDLRHILHVRAFGRDCSAKEIDHLKMFDAFKAEVLALTAPVDLAAQLRQANMDKTRLLHAIQQLSTQLNDLLPENSQHESGLTYAWHLAMDRFHTPALEQLSLRQLTQLRYTLAARVNTHRREARAEAAAVTAGNAPF